MTQHLPVTIDQSTPAPQQFSRESQADFLDALSGWGNVRAAARSVGVSRSTAYRMRRACPRFRALWDAALLIARPQVEEVLADRALNGTRETVFYHGEEVATRQRFDGRLLLAHLGRLDRLINNRDAREAAKDFDRELDELTEEAELTIVAIDTEAEADGAEQEI